MKNSARYCHKREKLDFNESLISNKAQILNFIKTRPKETELFRVDRRTDMIKLIVAFRNFTNAAKKQDAW